VGGGGDMKRGMRKGHTNKRKRKNRIDYKKTGVTGNCI
jgi:hypothetical protein